MRSTLIFKNIHEEKKLTWEGSARVLGQFACKKLNMNSTYEEINIFISRVHKCRKYLSKNYHKGSKPLFSQFTNCRFEEEICTKIINLTSKRRLNVYVSQPISKELTETTNEALKHIKQLLETEPQLTVTLDYTAVLRNRPKGSRSKWKVSKHFTPDRRTYSFFLLHIVPQTKYFREPSVN